MYEHNNNNNDDDNFSNNNKKKWKTSAFLSLNVIRMRMPRFLNNKTRRDKELKNRLKKNIMIKRQHRKRKVFWRKFRDWNCQNEKFDCVFIHYLLRKTLHFSIADKNFTSIFIACLFKEVSRLEPINKHRLIDRALDKFVTCDVMSWRDMSRIQLHCVYDIKLRTERWT